MSRFFFPAIAFAGLAAFLLILLVGVPRLDLGVVIGLTLLLAFIDFFIHKPTD